MRKSLGKHKNIVCRYLLGWGLGTELSYHSDYYCVIYKERATVTLGVIMMEEFRYGVNIFMVKMSDDS